MVMDSAAPKQWMSVKEVADYLGLKPPTIYQYVSERRIPHHKIPGSHVIKFKASEIDNWMDTGRVETKKEYLDRIGGENYNGQSAPKETRR